MEVGSENRIPNNASDVGPVVRVWVVFEFAQPENRNAIDSVLDPAMFPL